MRICQLKANRKITRETILDSISASGEFTKEGLGSYTHSFDMPDLKITVYVTEKYFYRITSTLTVTLIIKQTEQDTTIDIISSGGKRSNELGLFVISWGAEKSALEDVVVPLKRLGFAEVTE